MPKKSSTKKNAPEAKSPSNPRSFTERIRTIVIYREWKVIASSFVIGVICMGILFTTVDIIRLMDEQEMQQQEKIVLAEEIQKWEKIVQRYPDYRDGYFKLALLQVQSGNRNEAIRQLENVKKIDPQFGKIDELEGLLTKY